MTCDREKCVISINVREIRWYVLRGQKQNKFGTVDVDMSERFLMDYIAVCALIIIRESIYCQRLCL